MNSSELANLSNPSSKPEAVDLKRPHTWLNIAEPHLEADGFPKEFHWSLAPSRGLPWPLKLFYLFFDPVRFSLFTGRLARSKISRYLVRPFAFLHQIDLAHFISSDGAHQYKSFDQFFTRRLSQYPRFQEGRAATEGTLVYLGRGGLDQALTLKGENISLRELVGEKVLSYLSGRVIVMITYLSPRDYHLGHSPLSGKVIYKARIPGKAFTVRPEIWNELNIEGRPGTHYLNFNTRDVILKESAQGFFATVYVAATNVYSTEIHPQVGDSVKAGEHEQSYHFGSTNVYIFDADQCLIPSGLYPGYHFIFGQSPMVISSKIR